ncbi:MAG: hypothetical protein ABEL76_17125, partial [Bradymonadaceae bacterium]
IIGVAPKGGGNYRVDIVHKGKSRIEDLKVALFPAPKSKSGGQKGGKSCGDLRDAFDDRRDPSTNATIPPADLEVTDQMDANGKTGEVLIPRDRGKAYTVWVRGYKLTANTNEPPVEYAWGCATGGKVSPGKTVEVDVALRDQLPLLKSRYDKVTHHYNLVGVLPPNIRRIINLVGMFTKSPGAFVVGCDKDKTTGRNGKKLCPQGDVPGLLEVLKDQLPSNLAQAIDDLKSSGIWGSTLRQIIDQVAFSIIGQSKLAGESINIARDVYDNLRNFRVRGPITFDRAQLPKPSYGQNGSAVQQSIPKAAAVQKWNEFGFFWNDGCKNAKDPKACRTKWFSARKIIKNKNRTNAAGASGHFAAMRGGLKTVSIEPHSLKVNFGGLLIGLLERVVLPRYFSDGVQRETVVNLDDNCPNRNKACPDGEVTFTELFRAVLDCNDVADAVDKRVGLGSTAKKVCRSLQSQIVARLKGYIRKQLSVSSKGVVELESGTLIREGETHNGQTCSPKNGKKRCEVDAPCTLEQPATYPGSWKQSPLPYVQSFGSKDPHDARCDWIVDVTFSGQYTGKVAGTFYGPTP